MQILISYLRWRAHAITHVNTVDKASMDDEIVVV